MGYCGRFSFEGYTPEYPSESAMLADLLRNICENAPQTYDAIVSWFLNDDKEALAGYLSRLYEKVREQRDKLKRAAELEEQLKQLQQKNYELQLELNNVYSSAAGLNWRIKNMYVNEQRTISEIADFLGKDRKTIRKHLREMGVYNEKSKDDKNTVKSLTQHLRF